LLFLGPEKINNQVIVNFEGSIGVGKSTLAQFISNELGCKVISEHIYQNPFIEEFCDGSDVRLETELTFLLEHYALLKQIKAHSGTVLTDFCIEKDLVFARMNLNPEDFSIFKSVYGYVIERVLKPNIVIFLDLPIDTIMGRILTRSRNHELKLNPEYFTNFRSQLQHYFSTESKNKVKFYNVIDLKLQKNNLIVQNIRQEIQNATM
jgi:deoxyadenosine/deoxycytidine kinase